MYDNFYAGKLYQTFAVPSSSEGKFHKNVAKNFVKGDSFKEYHGSKTKAIIMSLL